MSGNNFPDDFNLGGPQEPSLVEKTVQKLYMRYRQQIGRYTIYTKERWAFTGFLFFMYLVRVLMHGGFYVISYISGLYSLHSLVKFVQPLGLPDIEDDEEEKYGEELPTTTLQHDGDSKPLMRSLSEFNLWQGITATIVIANVLICSDVFDLPVYWPFLFAYFIFLVVITIKKQLRHQEKYKYSFKDFWTKAKR